ncbi:Las1-domain-containing protein [Marasmius fiardii PR-910]|nr:Las1-domain-containing protein [Marasmius fiardii PR-910]
MRLPRRVPWTSITELDQVCSWIFTDETDLKSKTCAINRLAAWKAITPLPHALESTHEILSVIVQDSNNEGCSFFLPLRQGYAAAIIRFVNGLVDPLQLGVYARSIAAIASQLDIPIWIVELRHAATHEGLPSLEVLREGARQSMSWLLHNYWLPTINPSTTSKPVAPLRPLSPILKQYKDVLKLVNRDASLKSRYKQSVNQILKEIEKWIAEAKVAANVATGELGWNTGHTTESLYPEERDGKEQYALEVLSDAFLEKGSLVPLSKKRRTPPTDSTDPPPDSVQIWAPLLSHVQSLHSNFYSTLINRMIHRLTKDAAVTTENSNSSDLQPSYDSSYAGCLGRWLLWVIATMESKYSDDVIRLDASAMLVTSIGPGSDCNPSSKKLLEALLKDLCSGVPDLEIILSTWKPLDDASAAQWSTNDISVMNDRLNALLSVTSDTHTPEPEETVLSEEPLTGGGFGELSGWRLLDEPSGWRPCPIGVYYVASS